MLTVLVRLFCESSREGGEVVRSADPGMSLGPVATSAPGSSLGPVASADPGKSLGPCRRCRPGLYLEVGRSGQVLGSSLRLGAGFILGSSSFGRSGHVLGSKSSLQIRAFHWVQIPRRGRSGPKASHDVLIFAGGS